MKRGLLPTVWGLALSALASGTALGQEVTTSPGATPAGQAHDTVRLKNGGVIRGLILEAMPGEPVRIQLPSGQIRSFPPDEVEYAGATDQDPSRRTPSERPTEPRIPIVALGAKQVRVRLRSNLQSMTFHLQSGSSVATAHGNGHVIHAQGKSYTPICEAPCDALLATGTYTLGLSYGTELPVPDLKQSRIQTDSTLYGEYTSHYGLRLVGTGVLLGSVVVGSALMLSPVLKNDGRLEPDSVSFIAGLATYTIGGLVGWYLSNKPDEVSIAVSPMTAAAASLHPAGAARDLLPAGGRFVGTF